MNSHTDRSLLRHTIATLAYRGSKAFRDVPAEFSEYRVGPSSRTPGQILAHIGDLLDWAYWLAKGEHVWKESPPQVWAADVERFHAGLTGLDEYLASDAPLGFSAEQIFQGPIADAFTHIGQIAMLRRLASGPVKGENYFRAQIVAGRVGPDQAKAAREF